MTVRENVLLFNLTPRYGMLHYASQFANELAHYKHVTVVIADYYNGPLYDNTLDIRKIKTDPDIKNFLIDSIRIWNHLLLVRKIIIRKPTVLHFIDNHPRYILYGLLFKLLGYTIYVTQHDPILHSGENKTLQGYIASMVNAVLRRIADKVIVHGEKLKKELIQRYGTDAKKVVAIAHGNYNFFRRRAQGSIASPNTILFFGRIVAYKGLDTLLQSLVYITQEYKLIIAGSGNLEPYTELIQQHKEHITVYNKDIPDEEVYKYFEQAEFVVLPYKDASGSGVIPVAYAFGKPVIVTNVGELPSHVAPMETGLIVEKENPKALAKQIDYLLEHKTVTQTLGKAGYNYTLEVLGRDKIVKAIYPL